jgi:hypothetical protein
MGSIGTTAKPIFTTAKGKPQTVYIHADSGNTASIYLSQNDPTVTHDYEELLAGQSMSFEDFDGTIYGISASGTQTYHFPFAPTAGKIVKE